MVDARPEETGVCGLVWSRSSGRQATIPAVLVLAVKIADVAEIVVEDEKNPRTWW
jgi:hypothetical protein